MKEATIKKVKNGYVIDTYDPKRAPETQESEVFKTLEDALKRIEEFLG